MTKIIGGLLLVVCSNAFASFSPQPFITGQMWKAVYEVNESKFVPGKSNLDKINIKVKERLFCVSKKESVMQSMLRDLRLSGCIANDISQNKNSYNAMSVCGKTSGVYKVSFDKNGYYTGDYSMVVDYKYALLNQSGTLLVTNTKKSCGVK